MGILKGRPVSLAVSLLGAVALLNSCATAMSGTTQTISIASDPPGAACEVRSKGALLVSVPRTPQAVIVPRSKDTIQLTCTRADHEATTELLESKFSGATIGNFLAGGLIGVAIDAASGANNFYPAEVTVLMQPSVFADEAAREAFFGRLTSRVRKQADSDLTMLRYQCASKPREFCDADSAKIRARRDNELAELDARRLAARVAPAAGNTKR